MIETLTDWLVAAGLPEQLAGQFVAIAAFLSGAIVTVIVGVLVVYRYLRREFADRVVYGVNHLTETSLQLRTVEALPLSEILTENKLFRFRLLRAFSRARPENPFVNMAQRDLDVLKPAVLNGLARTFSTATLADFFGRPTEKHRALLATLYETDPRVQVRMMRVIITTDAQLGQVRKLAAEADIKDRLTLSSEHHWTRFKTLQRIAERRQRELAGLEDRRLIDEIEIAFLPGDS